MTEGEIGDSMYFVVDGAVEEIVMKTNTSQRTLVSGDTFGDIACLFDERRHVSDKHVQAECIRSNGLFAAISASARHNPRNCPAAQKTANQRHDLIGQAVYRALFAFSGGEGDDRTLTLILAKETSWLSCESR